MAKQVAKTYGEALFMMAVEDGKSDSLYAIRAEYWAMVQN